MSLDRASYYLGVQLDAMLKAKMLALPWALEHYPPKSKIGMDLGVESES